MVGIKALAAVMAVVPMAFAHPGESVEAVKREMAVRNLAHAAASRSLGACEGSPEALAVKERSIARRTAKLTELRAKRGLTTEPLGHQKRDLTDLGYYETVNHNETTLGYTLNTPETTIFGSNNTCALVPETTIGPYYVTGEYIRSNITEGHPGVPMHIDIQFVDMNTCGAVPSLMADVWHCNATGTYSGIETSKGEGGLNSTFLRGVQMSDDDGTVAFDTIVPGHYDGRINHFHLVVEANATVLPNDTYIGGNTLHIGQIYFDDTLIEAVEATSPYSSNTIEFTTWEEDGWMLEEATTEYDPFIEYVQLSDNLDDGILAWITVALDMSSNHSSNLTAAAHYYETGGVGVPNSSSGLPPSNPNASP